MHRSGLSIEKPRPDWSAASMLASPIFTPSHPGTIFGTRELNYCVRNGNRWTLTVINTNCIVRYYKIPSELCQVRSGDPGGNRTHVNGVRGRCLNRLTTGPHHRTNTITAPAEPLAGICGAPSRTRTGDPLIKSQLLYQLS